MGRKLEGGTADRRVRKVINEDGELVLTAGAANEARRSWHIAADRYVRALSTGQ